MFISYVDSQEERKNNLCRCSPLVNILIKRNIREKVNLQEILKNNTVTQNS